MATATHEIIGVFKTPGEAKAAADAVAGIARSSRPRVDDHDADVASLKAEMHEEINETVVGPGNIGPFTKEMRRGLVRGVVAGAVAGAVLALPIALIPWMSLEFGTRLVIAAIVGASAGATVGFMFGGFTARGGDRRMAAEIGTTVVIDVRTPDEVEQVRMVMERHHPIRIDLATREGDAVENLSTDDQFDS